MMEATCDDCGQDFEADTIESDLNGDVSCDDCITGRTERHYQHYYNHYR